MEKTIIRLFGIFLACTLSLACFAGTAEAKKRRLEVLYVFGGEPDGVSPFGGVVMDKMGNLYGATVEGGESGSHGVAFKLGVAGKETVLHAFHYDTEGYSPLGTPLLGKGGILYGTLEYGPGSGDGAVYALARDGGTTILHTFAGGTDGAFPFAGVVSDLAGNLYGTAINGGVGNNLGVVYKLAPDGTETILHVFEGVCCGRTDGSFPYGALIRDAAGNLYGTTYNGGDPGCDCGTVFEIAPDGTETILHAFSDAPDGAHPQGGVFRDRRGNLFGMTALGGAHALGTIFMLSAAGSEAVLHSFAGGRDGANPIDAPVVDASGIVYGTTENGGGACDCGTVFQLASDGKERILHAFAGHPDGAFPEAGLLIDTKGNLYGTTSEGGNKFNDGIVFKIKAASKSP